jgi:hypothetical protein
MPCCKSYVDRDKLFLELERLAEEVESPLIEEGIRMAMDTLNEAWDEYFPATYSVELQLERHRVWELENEIRSLTSENDNLRYELLQRGAQIRC